ncbi:MAG TPA: hypothetical protein VHD87_06420, partial [Acidimicrobiales bacterium]|nr:hypothetical protein [Acidimicrobiales bacterium]
LRRYMPLYVFGTIWLLMIALFPTINHNSTGGGDTQVLGASQQRSALGRGSTAAPDATGDTVDFGTGDTGPGATGPDTSVTGDTSSNGTTAAAETGTGVTTGGVACSPGVRQLPFSQYAAPCVAKFTGNNGGATARGVDAKTIKIVIRRNSDASGPNAQATNQVAKESGNATADEANQYGQELLPYFNKMFELYGRKVVMNVWDGQGNGTDEAQSQGQEAACADATNIAETQKAFGAMGYGFAYLSQPFADCAKREQIYVPLGGAYFPESYYQKWDPYVWAGTMECERISRDAAEYVGKRLAHKKAQWAGDPLLQNAERKFGTYVPNNDGYQHCVDLFESTLKQNYNQPITSRYDYTLDVSQFPSEAARGIVQFNAAHVSTIIMACDPISMIFLTQAATKQNYHPEWFNIGVAADDTDGFARLWDSTAIDGHLFGMSQLGTDAKIFAQNGEAAQAYKAATGKAMPQGAAGVYYALLQLFNQLQSAGPNLTAANIAVGTHNMPDGGGSSGAVGTWRFKGDHTAIEDSREIYWDSKATGYDGKKGDYVETYGGKRFKSGEWPAENPPIKPE